jgi:alkanesulfonate monooxygenase SsuD/methylene tetrahydromethanopterin reductase-like flavin-dependent oxidoreductase (luciferase family)
LDQKEASDRLEEAIPLVQRFLAGDEVSYEGRFWSGTGARVVPDAVQRPTPPLWLSGHSASTIERAGRLGVNFCTGFVSSAEVRERRAAYREAWNSVPGRGDPGRVGHMILAAVGDSRAEIDEMVVPAMKSKLYEFAQRALRERYEVESFDELSEKGIVVYGTAEECTERIGRISEEAGDALLVQTRFGELDPGFSRESIRRLAEEILPRVSGRPASAALV